MVLNRVPKQVRLIALHLTALFPLVWLVWDVLTGNLSLNPYENLIRRTGQAAVLALIFTLSCTPLSRWINRPSILVFRKPLGLYTFFYALLHLSIFFIMGYEGNLVTATREILARTNLTLGLVAFLILIILAATSNRGTQEMLKKNWKNIQRLIYPAALLIGGHYLMARKAPTPAGSRCDCRFVVGATGGFNPLEKQSASPKCQKFKPGSKTRSGKLG